MEENQCHKKTYDDESKQRHFTLQIFDCIICQIMAKY